MVAQSAVPDKLRSETGECLVIAVKDINKHDAEKIRVLFADHC